MAALGRVAFDVLAPTIDAATLAMDDGFNMFGATGLTVDDDCDGSVDDEDAVVFGSVFCCFE